MAVSTQSAVMIGVLTGLVTAGAVAVASSASSGPVFEPPAAESAGFGELRKLAARLELPKDWTDFFVLVAWNESRGNSRAINDDAGEKAAAKVAYERNAEHLSQCHHAPATYLLSGGWFGLLAPNALMQFKTPELRCLPPRFAVTDPATSFAIAVGMARGLMTWGRFEKVPTFGNLRLMWRSPKSGGDPAKLAKRLPKYRDHARAAGVAPSLLDAHPRLLHLTADEAYARLKGRIA